MKKIFLLYSVFLFSSCGLRGWFPGWDDNPQTSMTQPAQGCNKDVTVHYKNNCSKNLIMYLLKSMPGQLSIVKV